MVINTGHRGLHFRNYSVFYVIIVHLDHHHQHDHHHLNPLTPIDQQTKWLSFQALL